MDSINASSADHFYAYNAPDFGTVLWHFEILQGYFQDVGLDTIVGNIEDKVQEGFMLSVSIKPSKKNVAAVKNTGSQICVLQAIKEGSSVKISLYAGVLTQTIEAYVKKSHEESVESLECYDKESVA